VKPITLEPIILASGSPRRRDLLTEAGIKFEVVISPAEEIHDTQIPLYLLCEENAKLKALAVAQDYPNAIVIGADTLVSIDDIPLGKPKDEDDARRMLRRLSGQTQDVCTGVSLVKNESVHCFHVITQVLFKNLSDRLIRDYMKKVNVMDKAGAYAVQEHGEMIIECVKGDYDNVVGLPVARLVEELKKMV